MVLADAPRVLTVRERAVDALLACIARHGLAKTTLDDVARAAGCSRATLYRHFANKSELVHAVIAAEFERFEADLAAATEPCVTLGDACTEVVHTTAAFVADHAALQFLLDHEQPTVLPFLTFEGGDAFLARMAPVLGAPLARFLDPVSVERAGEWLARLLMTSLTFADERADLTEVKTARALVEQFVVPVLADAPAAASEVSA